MRRLAESEGRGGFFSATHSGETRLCDIPRACVNRRVSYARRFSAQPAHSWHAVREAR